MAGPETITTRRLTTEIVTAFARRNQVTADQLADIISAVYEALSRHGKPIEEIVADRFPAVPIRRSVHHDYVVCLECGWRGKMLRRHIHSQHGLT